MTNTEHTALRTRNTKALALSMLAMLLAMFLALLAGPQQAQAGITFPQIYTVNQIGDQPDADLKDSRCDVDTSLSGYQCTLRAAIEQTNAIPGADAINFDIPLTGVHTIKPNTGLPEITDAVTINGYSQPGASVNTLAKGTDAKLMIQLDGSAVSSETAGLSVTAPDVVLKGLVINRFAGGIGVSGAASDTKIAGNFIGTDPSGTKALGNSEGGMYIREASNVTVGGPSPASRNLISGNGETNFDHAISILGDGNKVYGNLIGTQKDGKSPLGNAGDGVEIISTNYQSSSLNAVGATTPDYANTIAFNGGDGVSIYYFYGPPSYAVSYNFVLSNSIFSNKGLGIDLGDDGVTPNDAGDADQGPNNLQNKPVLSSAKMGAGKTTITGKLNSAASQSFKLQFFSNPKGTDQGKKLLFSRTVVTDGTGNVSFTFATKKKVSLGQNITATATNLGIYETSEFCAPRKVVAS